MPNIFWYCVLGLIGLSVTGLTIYKKRDKHRGVIFLVFFFVSTSITWIGEFVVLGLFNSYAYITGIFTSPWAQNLLGHLILNSTFYPGTAILVAVYALGIGWISLITIFYLLMEYLFLKLGIYEHHWWKSYMTVICIFVYQLVTKSWFEKMHDMKSGFLRFITFYLVGFVLLHYPVPVLLLLGKEYYHVNWVSDLYLASTLFIFTYQLAETVLLVFFVCVLEKWYWKIIPFGIAIIGQRILLNLKILVLCEGWNFLYTMTIYYLSITVFILIVKNFIASEVNNSYPEK